MAQMTVIAIAIDFANVAHAQAFAQIAALAAQNGMALQVGVGAPAPAPAPAPVAQEPATQVKAPKAYKPTEDRLVRLVVDKTLVSVTTLDGKFEGVNGVRKTVNARIRKAGGVYDQAVKAYRFTKSANAKAFAVEQTTAANEHMPEAVTAALSNAECKTEYVALVTAAEWQAFRDKQAGKEKKA